MWTKFTSYITYKEKVQSPQIKSISVKDFEQKSSFISLITLIIILEIWTPTADVTF